MNPLAEPNLKAEERSLLFVVGLTRSGTSLLYALLNQHPQIALMYEANACYPGLRSFTPRNLERLEIWNQAISRHGLKSMDLEKVRDARSLYLAYAKDKEHCKIYGEKSPIYPAYLPGIFRRSPDARFLFLSRDFAQIYRSVLDAGHDNAWFNKRGSYYRLLREQEKMIHDQRRLEKLGAKIHRVSYQELIEHTGETVRRICDFLGIEFDKGMLSLHGSDLSAIQYQPEHDHLRAREIIARNGHEITIPESRRKSIARFQQRWNRLLDSKCAIATPAAEASRAECFFYQTIGTAFIFYYLLVRWMYEWLPVGWIRNYRALKIYLGTQPGPGNLSRAEKIKTTGFAIAMLLGICGLNLCTARGITLAPFYLLPVAFVTYRLGMSAGSFIAILTGAMWTAIQLTKTDVEHIGLVFSWNLAMRSVEFLIFAALISVSSRLLSSLVKKDELFSRAK